MTFDALFNFVGFVAMVLFFSVVAGAGLYIGAYFTSTLWPFGATLRYEEPSRTHGRRKGEDRVAAAPQSAVRNPQSEGAAS